MVQTSFALDDTQLADPQVGFDIGWDHARHGLPPPPEQWPRIGCAAAACAAEPLSATGAAGARRRAR